MSKSPVHMEKVIINAVANNGKVYHVAFQFPTECTFPQLKAALVEAAYTLHEVTDEANGK